MKMGTGMAAAAVAAAAVAAAAAAVAAAAVTIAASWLRCDARCVGSWPLSLQATMTAGTGGRGPAAEAHPPGPG